MALLFYKLNKRQLKIAEGLRNSGMKTRAVIGRGSVFIEAKEIAQSEKFKDLLARADLLTV